jgi:predicted RNase H-like HicB family nuclease
MNQPKYAVVIEKGATSYGAYVPDLPGCVAVAETRDEVEKLIAEAIAFHIEGLLENGDPVPVPSSEVEYIEPAAVA